MERTHATEASAYTHTVPPPPADVTRPTGRDEVRRAVLDAAIRLFVDRGPAAVSLRDIAAEANVNLGLLYRHFGTKAELLSATVDGLVERFGAVIAGSVEAPDMALELATIVTGSRDPSVTPMRPYARMLAWLLLDGANPLSIQSSYPVYPRLVERLTAEGRDPEDARLTSLVIFSIALGWLLFAPYLNAAASLDDVPLDDLRHALADAFGRLVERGAQT
jgi:AcrR family transcriptional regulator